MKCSFYCNIGSAKIINHAVQNISLTVKEVQSYGLVGEPDSGKSIDTVSSDQIILAG
ncbi:MAG: hypothetical protein OCC45_03225 [Desulfotalea sp.]